MNEKPRILVACNTLTSVSGETYPYHMKLFYDMGRRHPEYDFMQCFAQRMSIDNFRNYASKVAIQNDCTYLMFIDDDMKVTPDIFTKLLEGCETQGYDILAAFNYIRGYPFKIMSFKYDLLSGHKRLLNLTEADVANSPKGSIIPCAAIGTAVCLISTRCFRKTPPPYFLTGAHGTEDIYFCLKAVDYDPSIRIGMHTGCITGHLLEPEGISHDTRAALMKYYEAFMPPEMIYDAQKDLPGVGIIPQVGNRELYYEDIMGMKYEGLIQAPSEYKEDGRTANVVV